jgi:peroxiredoxin (alkyl hydroperoxide reductase subunit C)
MIGKRAPQFLCNAVIDGNIKQVSLDDFGSSYKLLFFYPLNFTFVCPTEMHALEAAEKEFNARNTQVIAISVDSAHSHLAWLQTPRAKGGIEGISYPILSDLTKEIARAYGVLNEDLGIAFRGVFLLDENNIVHHASINNLPLGRNINEYLRLVDALRFYKKNGEVCPANWTPGERTMKPTQEGLSSYFSEKKV